MRNRKSVGMKYPSRGGEGEVLRIDVGKKADQAVRKA